MSRISFKESLDGWLSLGLVCIAVNVEVEVPSPTQLNVCVWGRRAGVKFAPAKLLPNSPLGDLGAILGTHSEDWSLLSQEKFRNIATFFAHTCVHVCECV